MSAAICIIILVIIFVLVFQIIYYDKVKTLNSHVADIFPKRADDKFALVTDEQKACLRIDYQWDNKNGTRNEIVSTLNNYLRTNGNSASDFQLMKDIVERNCEAKDNEIQSLTPIPIYCGLAGTMAGIVIGLVSLIGSGDIRDMLSPGSVAAGESIGSLLFDVALAMGCSMLGILLTAVNTVNARDSRAKCEAGMNSFLSWLQTNLLPQMTSDAGSALALMTKSLNEFNKSFSENASQLKNALKSVGDVSRQQNELINSIHKLDLFQLTAKNAELFNTLNRCVEQIKGFGATIDGCRQFVEEMRLVNDRLDMADKRSQMMERMAQFFDKWEGEITNTKQMSQDVLKAATSAINETQHDLAESRNMLADSALENISEAANNLKFTLEQVTTEFKDSVGSITSNLNVVVDTVSYNMDQSVNALNEFMQKMVSKLKLQSEDIVDEATESLNANNNFIKQKLESNLQAVGDSLEKSAEQTKEAVSESLKAMRSHSQEQIAQMQEVVKSETEAMKERATEMSSMAKQLGQLTEMRELMAQQTKATLEMAAAMKYMAANNAKAKATARDVKGGGKKSGKGNGSKKGFFAWLFGSKKKMSEEVVTTPTNEKQE